MWKEFFYFNKGQRRGIIILISLIVLSFLATELLPLLLSKKTEDSEGAKIFLSQAKEFKAALREKEKNFPRREYRPFQQQSYSNSYNEQDNYTLFAFDPNLADSATFVALGLRPYIARNIINYRNKGGKFRNSEAFAKIYGISNEKFEELQPYIRISEEFAQSGKAMSDTMQREMNVREKPAFSQKAELDYLVELNSADTTELKKVRGIGSYYARNIIAYRKVLGGYYSVEQLREVRGMNDENFNRIKHSLTADGTLINKVNVNRASVDYLRRHPYIGSFQRAKAVYDYRRKIGKLNSIDDLNVLDEFTEDELLRLTPYLDFP